jgi:hypothetical protein
LNTGPIQQFSSKEEFNSIARIDGIENLKKLETVKLNAFPNLSNVQSWLNISNLNVSSLFVSSLCFGSNRLLNCMCSMVQINTNALPAELKSKKQGDELASSIRGSLVHVAKVTDDGAAALALIGDDDKELEALLKKNPALLVQWRDAKGNSLLHIACRRGLIDSVNLMLGCCATPQDAQALVNAVNASGQTPLHEAAAKGHVAMVRYLIEKGVTIDAKANVRSLPEHGELTDRVHF